ncbi:MAG: hypothetical protein QGG71_22685 [Pirellulaceae bacterium]|jgi:hypothetical protein|nr:hypothetical protein [Pirellulaceae bacterium]
MITRVAVAVVALLCIVGVVPEMAESQDPTSSIPVEVQTLRREGYGAASKGGDGGRVIWVTNLKDSGPGSLRAALAIEEPRIVKFKVGGVIELERPIAVKFGRVTIDGLSAAAQGGITVQGGFHIRGCEDVIVRHIRSRGGYDTLLILQSRRILIDHVSTAWALDENIDVWDSRDVTLAWCIVAEGAVEGHHEGVHSMGSLQSGGTARVTTHHCLFTGNIDRNPIITGPKEEPKYPLDDYRYDVINNVIYNYWNASKFAGYARVNFVGNYFRPGPDSSLGKWEVNILPKHKRWKDVSMEPQVFCSGNRGPHRQTDDLDELSMVMIYGKENSKSKAGIYGAEAEQFIARKPFGGPVDAMLEPQPAEQAYRQVLAQVGAWPRDEVDLRLIREVREKQGKIGRVGPRWRQIYEEQQRKQQAKKRR